MKGNVIADAEIKALIEKSFIFAELYTDRSLPEDQENLKLRTERFGNVLPLYVTLDADGKELSRLEGIATKASFLEFLRKGLPASNN